MALVTQQFSDAGTLINLKCPVTFWRHKHRDKCCCALVLHPITSQVTQDAEWAATHLFIKMDSLYANIYLITATVSAICDGQHKTMYAG